MADKVVRSLSDARCISNYAAESLTPEHTTFSGAEKSCLTPLELLFLDQLSVAPVPLMQWKGVGNLHPVSLCFVVAVDGMISLPRVWPQ